LSALHKGLGRGEEADPLQRRRGGKQLGELRGGGGGKGCPLGTEERKK